MDDEQRIAHFICGLGEAKLRAMRSKLFIPGSRPELFDKAVAGPADALCLDLEDSVVPERKDEARAHLPLFVQAAARSGTNKICMVRINALHTPQAARDMVAAAVQGIHYIAAPKVETAEQVRALGGMLERAAADNAVRSSIGLVVTVETPRALRDALALATAHPLVRGLQLGLGDLFEPHGIARTAHALGAAMWALRLAAAEAGVFAYDSAYPGIADTGGFRAEAALARDLGFMGKSCIHPSQVAIANEVFSASDSQIAAARRVVLAADQAEASGLGAFTVDGSMVDGPFLQSARALLERAALQGRQP